MNEAPPEAPAAVSNLRVRPEVVIVLITVASAFLVYAPFLSDMTTVYRFWDGPNYLTIARTLYDIVPDNPLLAYVYKPSYFATHLPVYPLLVRLFSFAGYQPALLLVSVLAACIAALLFFRLARDVWRLSSPLFLTLIFLFLPPRWLLYRSTGATESVFIALALASVYFFERGRLGRSALAAGLAAATRISGLMFLPAYLVELYHRFAAISRSRRSSAGDLVVPRPPWRRKQWRSILWLGLIPSGLLLYFLFCAMRFGSFFAYFAPHREKLAAFVPFGFLPELIRQGLYHQAEFHILLALVYAVGITRLRAFPALFWYCVFQFVFHIFISTEDWSRYFLAMAPFALVVGYRDLLDTRPVRWIFPGYVALAYVYCWGVIPVNGCRPDIYLRLLHHLGLLGELPS